MLCVQVPAGVLLSGSVRVLHHQRVREEFRGRSLHPGKSQVPDLRSQQQQTKACKQNLTLRSDISRFFLTFCSLTPPHLYIQFVDAKKISHSCFHELISVDFRLLSDRKTEWWSSEQPAPSNNQPTLSDHHDTPSDHQQRPVCTLSPRIHEITFGI